MKPVLIKVKQTDANYPEDLRYDDNSESVYAVEVDGKRIGFVYRIPSERAWHARDENGERGPVDENFDGPIFNIFTTTRGLAVTMLVRAQALIG
jgi:hypothetical protein